MDVREPVRRRRRRERVRDSAGLHGAMNAARLAAGGCRPLCVHAGRLRSRVVPRVYTFTSEPISTDLIQRARSSFSSLQGGGALAAPAA